VNNKIVVFTGASDGIGAAGARQLHAMGATVVVVGRSPEKTRAVADNDLEVEHGYTQRIAYGNAKLENILFTKELHRRCHDQGISTAAFHPGNVASNFANDTDSLMRYVYHTPLRRLILISPAKAADTLVWLANTTPGSDWQSGEYYYQREIEKATDQACDPSLAMELWEQSAKFCDL
jgi:NAD(P)-dependent dehydrogenase (short-subunit alcohol dehydrogenase family)